MRPIKFRAWDEEAEEMLYSDKDYERCTFVCEEDGILKCYVPEEIAATQDEPAYTVGREIFPIMQDTGLKDKNGKEIYEGDIFGNILQLRCVVKREKDGAYKLHFLDKRIKPISILDHKISKSEVIGDIHQHPKLLDNNGT